MFDSQEFIKQLKAFFETKDGFTRLGIETDLLKMLNNEETTPQDLVQVKQTVVTLESCTYTPKGCRYVIPILIIASSPEIAKTFFQKMGSDNIVEDRNWYADEILTGRKVLLFSNRDIQEKAENELLTIIGLSTQEIVEKRQRIADAEKRKLSQAKQKSPQKDTAEGKPGEDEEASGVSKQQGKTNTAETGSDEPKKPIYPLSRLKRFWNYVYNEDPLRFWVAVLITLGVISLFIPPLAAIVLPGVLASVLWVHISVAVLAALTAFFSSHALMAICDYIGVSEWVHEAAKFLLATDRGIAFWLVMATVSVPTIGILLATAATIISGTVGVMATLIAGVLTLLGVAVSIAAAFFAIGLAGVILQAVSMLGIPAAQYVQRQNGNKVWRGFCIVLQTPFFALKKLGTLLCDIAWPVIGLFSAWINGKSPEPVFTRHEKVLLSPRRSDLKASLAQGMAGDLLVHEWTSRGGTEMSWDEQTAMAKSVQGYIRELVPKEQAVKNVSNDSSITYSRLLLSTMVQMTMLEESEKFREMFITDLHDAYGVSLTYYEALCLHGSFDVIQKAWELYCVPILSANGVEGEFDHDPATNKENWKLQIRVCP